MKTSLILSLAIGVVGAFLYFWQSDAIGEEQERRSELAEEALALGLSPDGRKATKSVVGSRKGGESAERSGEWRPLFDMLFKILPIEECSEEELSSIEQDLMAWTLDAVQLEETSLVTLLEKIKETSYDGLVPKEYLLQGLFIGILQERPEVGLPLLDANFDGLFEEDEDFLDGLVTMAMQRWGQSDAGAAEKWLEENESLFSSEIRENFEDQLLLSFIMEDPESSYTRFTSLADEDLKRWRINPFGEPHFLENLEDPGSMLNFLQVGKLALESKKNSPERMELLKGINQEALRLFSKELANSSSKESVKMLEDPRLSVQDQQAVLGYFSNIREMSNPDVWLAYASENASPKNREQLLTRMVSNWTKNDFRATAQWIGTQPEGELRELATYSFAQAVAPHEPDSAAEWAETLPAGPKRTELLEQIHQDWQKVDSEGAVEFSRKHGLAPAE